MKPQHNKYHKRMQQKNCDLPSTLESTLPAGVHHILVQERNEYT